MEIVLARSDHLLVSFHGSMYDGTMALSLGPTGLGRVNGVSK